LCRIQEETLRKKLTKAGLRHRIERQIGKVPDEVWEDVPQETIQFALDGAMYADEEVLEAVQTRKRIWSLALSKHSPSRRLDGRRGPKALDKAVPKLEARRAEVLARAYAHIAARRQNVRSFQEDYLGGTPVSADVARRLLASPAARLVPATLFAKYAIPILDHSSISRIERRMMKDGTVFEQHAVQVNWGGKMRQETVGVPVRDAYGPIDPVTLNYPAGGWIHQLEVQRGSILHRLQACSTTVAKAFGWASADTTWFILTGDIPPRPVAHPTVEHHTAGDHVVLDIVLRIQAWASAETVRRVFLDAQEWATGREARSISEEALRAFEFVETQRGVDGKFRDWYGICRKLPVGDRPTPANRGREPWRNFQRDYARTARTLLFPRCTQGRGLLVVLKDEKERRRFRDDVRKGGAIARAAIEREMLESIRDSSQRDAAIAELLAREVVPINSPQTQTKVRQRRRTTAGRSK
jgi:hypothetical protein